MYRLYAISFAVSVGFGTWLPGASASGAAAPSINPVSKFAGVYQFETGAQNCAAAVTIRNSPGPQDLQLLSAPGAVVGNFLAINGGGSFSPPTDAGGSTWTANEIVGAAIVQRQAESLLFRPLPLFAKQVAELSLSANEELLIWTYDQREAQLDPASAFGSQITQTQICVYGRIR